jgi:hypothetical protein
LYRAHYDRSREQTPEDFTPEYSLAVVRAIMSYRLTETCRIQTDHGRKAMESTPLMPSSCDQMAMLRGGPEVR